MKQNAQEQQADLPLLEIPVCKKTRIPVYQYGFVVSLLFREAPKRSPPLIVVWAMSEFSTCLLNKDKERCGSSVTSCLCSPWLRRDKLEVTEKTSYLGLLRRTK